MCFFAIKIQNVTIHHLPVTAHVYIYIDRFYFVIPLYNWPEKEVKPQRAILMALSLFAAPTAHYNNISNDFTDLSFLIDSCPLPNYQNHANHVNHANQTKILLKNLNESVSMEFNNHNNSSSPAHSHTSSNTNSPVHNGQQTQHHTISQNSDNNNNNNNNNSSSSSNNSNNNPHNNHIITTHNTSQHTNYTNRNLMNGFHSHIAGDYEQVLTFVDSPPNSEESWPDDQSKGSPGPQIINIQTIYTNSNSRKRRMDWDSLDIGSNHGENSINQHHNDELINKLTQHQHPQHQHQHNTEKDKYKREKLSCGRSTWSDDLGFDLNADFNTNSYINNESFMSFSPGLTVLKQEPQSEHLKISKTSLNTLQSSVGINGSKNEKINNQQESSSSSVATTAIQKHKTDHCVCNSPQNNATTTNGQLSEENVNQDKTNNNNILEPGRLNTAGIPHQLLTIVGTNKIEQNAASATGNTAITNHGSTTADTTTNSSVNTDDYKFQYILAAATSIATKNNEDTLTYLNQGQSYEIKLKKIGDLSFYRDKILKSVIKICFHERRLQFMEREQMQQWQASRPGERIIEVDVPLSYGLCHVNQSLNPNYLNTVEIFWDPMKEVGVYIKVNCISTEFTPKKHGGEKGVPFRLQIETYIENTNSNAIIGPKTPPTPAPLSPLSIPAGQSPTQVGNITPTSNGLQTFANALNIGGGVSGSGSGSIKHPIHAAACQIKVFKLKGADRKHKQDREKIQKRPQSEQEKFQPSYECTIMNDIVLEILTPTAVTAAAAAGGTSGNGCFSPEYMKIWPNSPVHIPKYDGILPYTGASPNSNTNSPIAINSVSSTNSSNLKLMDTNMVVGQPMISDMEDYSNNINIMPESSPAQVIQWLTDHRLTAYLSTFAHFSGADIMRMSKEDLIQICGLADGIRMYNVLRAKTITPRLTIYVSLDGSSYNAVYLITNTSKELLQKLFKLPGFYDIVATKSSTMNGNGLMETNAASFNTWNMHSKYSGSGSNIFNDVNNKTFIHISGPSGVHVAVTDEVLNNEIKDGSLYSLEVQNGKVLMKLVINNEK